MYVSMHGNDDYTNEVPATLSFLIFILTFIFLLDEIYVRFTL